MSSLIVGRDSQILMLELKIDKLIVPKLTPFDTVILSKSIVSFSFLDDEWIDIMPNRLDYKTYRGSNGEEQDFHGGKSIAFAVPESMLRSQQKNIVLRICVRREISRYFDTRGKGHRIELGQKILMIDDLFNDVVKELEIRREFGDYLQIAHERDPVSSSLKRKIELDDSPNKGIELQFYVRLSYLGSSVVTEIDRPSIDEPRGYFYAQEEKNLDKPYECLEIKTEQSPNSKLSDLTTVKAQPSLQLVCDCSDEQKYKLLFGGNLNNVCTNTDGDNNDGDDNDDETNKNKNGKKMKKQKKKKGKKDGEKGKNDKKGKKKSGSGLGPMLVTDKNQECQKLEPCEPCPIVCEVPCDLPCVPICNLPNLPVNE